MKFSGHLRYRFCRPEKGEPYWGVWSQDHLLGKLMQFPATPQNIYVPDDDLEALLGLVGSSNVMFHGIGMAKTCVRYFYDNPLKSPLKGSDFPIKIQEIMAEDKRIQRAKQETGGFLEFHEEENNTILVSRNGEEIGSVRKHEQVSTPQKWIPDLDLSRYIMRIGDPVWLRMERDSLIAFLKHFQHGGLPADMPREARRSLQHFGNELEFLRIHAEDPDPILEFRMSESRNECAIFRKNVFLATLTRKEQSWKWVPGYGLSKEFIIPKDHGEKGFREIALEIMSQERLRQSLNRDHQS